jgi:hypothetical protein
LCAGLRSRSGPSLDKPPQAFSSDHLLIPIRSHSTHPIRSNSLLTLPPERLSPSENRLSSPAYAQLEKAQVTAKLKRKARKKLVKKLDRKGKAKAKVTATAMPNQCGTTPPTRSR